MCDNLPKYDNLHIYIDFSWEEYINDKDYLFRIYKIVELAYQHKATIFCSAQQIQEFKDNCSNMDDNFSQSHGNKLDMLLGYARKKYERNYLFEICFSSENTSLKYEDDTSISIICSHSNNALISINKNNECKSLLSVKSATEFKKIDFIVLNNIDNFLQWIWNNSTRIFNLSPKHGENGRGNQPNQSVLLCSKEEAQQLLNTAIPDFNVKGKQIFNFDEIHQTFIEFFYEGNNGQNQWHGFHIKKEEWKQRIPEPIRKYFGTN